MSQRQRRHPDCALRQGRWVLLHRLVRCASPPSTSHGTPSPIPAKQSLLLVLGVVTSTALINQAGMQHKDRATTAGAPPGGAKTVLGWFLGGWPFGQICEKMSLRSLGLLGQHRGHTGVQCNVNVLDGATAQRRPRTGGVKLGGYTN